MILCSQPGCQTTAGCVCDRVASLRLVPGRIEISPAPVFTPAQIDAIRALIREEIAKEGK